MAGFTKKFVKRELIITLKSHNNNFPSVVFTLLRCVYGCLWPACACVRVHIYIYTKPRQQKFRAMNGAHLASPIRVMLIGPSWEPKLLPYWAPNSGPIRETRCQSPGLALNAHSGNEWGKIPVLT